MAQPDPSPTYIVVPTTWAKGTAVILTKTADFEEAKREAIRLTAANNIQHVVYTSTHYIDLIQDWPTDTADSLVLPIIPPTP